MIGTVTRHDIVYGWRQVVAHERYDGATFHAALMRARDSGQEPDAILLHLAHQALQRAREGQVLSTESLLACIDYLLERLTVAGRSHG